MRHANSEPWGVWHHRYQLFENLVFKLVCKFGIWKMAFHFSASLNTSWHMSWHTNLLFALYSYAKQYYISPTTLVLPLSTGSFYLMESKVVQYAWENVEMTMLCFASLWIYFGSVLNFCDVFTHILQGCYMDNKANRMIATKPLKLRGRMLVK